MLKQLPHAGHRHQLGLHPQAVRRARDSMLSDEMLATLARTFSALADPNRVKILSALTTGELCVADLAALLAVSESAVSQHLRLLRTLRWVRSRKAGRLVYYSLDDQHVRDLLDLEIEHLEGR